MFALLERSRWYPFVGYDRPPEDLREYVVESSDGEYTIPELLEYADYSRSKLSHYVEDADVLKRRVATQQTYLDGIDAEALTIEWPPDEAEVLCRRTREIRPFVARVADEETVAALRTVRLLTYDDEYDRLQTAAQAVAQLTPRNVTASRPVASRTNSRRCGPNARNSRRRSRSTTPSKTGYCPSAPARPPGVASMARHRDRPNRLEPLENSVVDHRNAAYGSVERPTNGRKERLSVETRGRGQALDFASSSVSYIPSASSVARSSSRASA